MKTTWLESAKNLPQGGTTRIDCHCGPGRTLKVSHDRKAYSAFCFRCDYQPYEYVGERSIKELARIRELNAQADEPLPLKLPEDYTEDIPLVGRLWLYSGGVGPSLWKKHRIGWSEKLQRVILPVYQGNSLSWFQARAVHSGQKPKYLGPDGDRNSIVYQTGDGNSSRAILVEDMLSAMRVGEVECCYSLLGTKITTAQANILSKHDELVTWLDNDRAGIAGALSVRKAVGLLVDVHNIRTDDDPKCYSRGEIKQIIGERDD